MWLTGFDVECLSTLYIDKPMKAHTLMQAIARANRVYPGKDFGLIVDYNGMLKSLREAWRSMRSVTRAGGEEIVAPIEERVKALLEAIEETEKHLRGLGFDPARLDGREGLRHGFKALADAVDAVYTSDESQTALRNSRAAGIHPVQGADHGADCVRLCRAPRQHRGDL